MNIKELFKNRDILPSVSLEEAGTQTESSDYVAEYVEQQEKFVPAVDYTDPSKFVRYGLAEQYYSGSISNIYRTYPYDGSLKEKLEWHNAASNLDNYVFKYIYPRQNGYINFSDVKWGAQDDVTEGYGLSDSLEYIYVKGGPNIDNKYDFSKNRESNLKIDGVDGNTVEFWLKKGEFLVDKSLTETEIVFDSWVTGSLFRGSTYGRMTVALTGSGDGDLGAQPILVTYMSGAAGPNQLRIGKITTSSIADNSWHHYAVVCKNNGSTVETRLFVDGYLDDMIASGSAVNYVSGTIIGTVGAQVTSSFKDNGVNGTLLGNIGWGKLSSSLDEFRFWKEGRSGEKIGKYWFTQVGGGTNTDDANTQLGVYYKFNEGTTNTYSVDKTVIDYSGRVSNGNWIGYVSGSRYTGSAIVESSASLTEFKDPIIYHHHPYVVNVIDVWSQIGEEYDTRNTANLYTSLPTWMIEEDRDNFLLRSLTQAVCTYFDELHLQIENLPRLRDASYVSSSAEPKPFTGRILQSEGLTVPELFVDAEIFETLSDRNWERNFEYPLHKIKNLIYQNIYNNLSYIYKSKGTEKAYRNLLRCYGIDESLVRINVYADNTEFEFTDNYKTTSTRKKFVDLNSADRNGGTIYQWSDDINSYGYISSSIKGESNDMDFVGFTLEGNYNFPRKKDTNSKHWFNTPFISSSLFGVHSVHDEGVHTETRWNTQDFANFQAYAVREQINLPHVKFLLTSSVASVHGGTNNYAPVSELTSALFYDVYDDTNWNLSVTVRPSRYPLTVFVSGSELDTRIVEFRGYRAELGEVKDSFCVTASVTPFSDTPYDLQNEFTGSKRVYAGAHRYDFTGSLLESSDVKIGAIRYWNSVLPNEALIAHAVDIENYGSLRPSKNAYPHERFEVPTKDTLILNWQFNDLTSSDALGMIDVKDLSSGSAVLASSSYQHYGGLLKYQHKGQGQFFVASDSNTIDVDYVVSSKHQLPELLRSSDMVDISEDEDKKFAKEHRPVDYFISFEKSMFQTISEEMINMFGTIVEFNDLIGAPVHRYRDEYKSLKQLRRLFYNNVDSQMKIERYVDFYKWIDDSIITVLEQLTPASANASEDVRTMIENHILERSKYKWKFPIIEKKLKEIPVGQLKSAGLRPVKTRPVTGNEKSSCYYWLNQADRRDAPLKTGIANIDNSKNLIFRAIQGKNSNNKTDNLPVLLGIEKTTLIGGGINYQSSKVVDGYNYLKQGVEQYMEIDSLEVKDTKVCNDEVGLKIRKFNDFKVEDK